MGSGTTQWRVDTMCYAVAEDIQHRMVVRVPGLPGAILCGCKYHFRRRCKSVIGLFVFCRGFVSDGLKLSPIVEPIHPHAVPFSSLSSLPLDRAHQAGGPSSCRAALHGGFED